jgi:hypothetical protein
MAEETSGWEDLKRIFKENNLGELADLIAQVAQDEGVDQSNIIIEKVRGTRTYQDRFKGNADRMAAGLAVLNEGEYIQNELSYAKTMNAYQAGGLATQENFAKLIANDVSTDEVSARFSIAYDRVQKAVTSNDKPLVDELRKLYPGITDNEIANSLVLGSEGSQYLKNKLDVVDIRAAETETGIKSTFGAERLAAEGLSRSQARIGLSNVATQKAGIEQASRMFGETSTEGLQQELEQENLLGQTSKRTKRLASQARAQFSGQSGIRPGSLGKKAQI